ncbi:rRNA methyltransferase 1, mitochondrial [Lachnellula occidentalis]|uniref:rRNA methyltransferase 1, mitochondrial n=1 Tax=Lachnellula occidentalis TaxID=215460 RepID=A0A8H8UKN5_9HELO|nr:rRNA methyltransferase 1, mitochondrial [Lachnellula occidentalis]
MINIALSRNIRHVKTPFSSSHLSYHLREASSVNTAIARGLRKSKGVGFRERDGASEKRGNGSRDRNEGGVVRRTAEPKGFQPHQPQMSREGWPGKPDRKDARRGFTGTEVRIHKGVKPVRTDAQLARKKPNPDGSSRNGGYKSDKHEMMRNMFDAEHESRPKERAWDRPKSQGTRGFDGGSSQRPQFGARARAPDSSFGDRGSNKFSNADSDVASNRPESRNTYPSLSFRKPKFEKDQQGPDSTNRNADRQNDSKLGKGYNGRERESRFTNRSPESKYGAPESADRQRQPYSADRKFEGRQPYSADRKFEGRQRDTDSAGGYTKRSPESKNGAPDSADRQRQPYSADRKFEGRQRDTDSAGGYTPRTPVKRFGSDADVNESSGPFTMRRGKDDTFVKSDEESSTSRTRPSKPVDTRVPISVPYTTPASEFLYGTSVVEAALKSRRIPRRQHYKLYIYTGENREAVDRDANLERLARKNQVDIVKVNGDGLRLMDKMSAGRPHNGYILEASPLPRLPVTSLGEITTKDEQTGFEVAVDYQSREDAAVNGTSNFVRIPKDRHGRKPLVLFLDSIVDPGNLGGIIRTASFLGVSAVAIATRNSAPFSPVVLKASAGASENMALFSVSKPAGFIQDSRLAGWKTFAAVAPSKSNDSQGSVTSMSTDDLFDPLSEDPCILMLGGEGEGLRQNMRSKADVELYIAGGGRSHTVDSLNVSVATGILCNAFLSKSKTESILSKDQEEPKESSSNDFLF